MLLSGCSQGKPLADLKLSLGACPAWTTNQGLAFLRRTKIMSCVNLVFLTVDLYSCLHWLPCNNLCAALDWWVKAVVKVLTRDVTYDARTKRQTNLQVMQLKIVSIFQEQSNWSEKLVLCVCERTQNVTQISMFIYFPSQKHGSPSHVACFALCTAPRF